ncbi:hypothetical protein Vretimale_11249 [Volvox reticuliferus]|uniref:Uncharacterized protein n=1 Tax=Volvox reticuliferus TaxID=1737510 RepID=A0A8J4CHT6_9CHLO|nr:hypothetical protein Vretifemale_12209 [Volvox reticuliferus]GIM07040.1 hypothetical protein Vretimale_11249 [Volvox reticuliferus]
MATGTGSAAMAGITISTVSAAGGDSKDCGGGDGGGGGFDGGGSTMAVIMASLTSTWVFASSKARQCWSRPALLDSTLYLPKTLRCEERCHRGCVRPTDFCCSCFCAQGCPCSCCACCDLRRSVCAAASWQFALGALLGSGFAAITALSFSQEPEFGNPNAKFYVGCCTVLDRQGILTYDPRALFMSQLYLGLNVLCILCHVTLAVLNNAMWHNALSRLALFITFVPLAWDWYITYLAWSLIYKLKEQRQGIFQGRPVMQNQSKPGQVLELHTGHNLALSPPPGQTMVPLALGVLGSVGEGAGDGGVPGPASVPLQLGPWHQMTRAGPHWSAPSIDPNAYTFSVKSKKQLTTAMRALSSSPSSQPPPPLARRTQGAVEPRSRSAVIAIHARSDGVGSGLEGASGSAAAEWGSRQLSNCNEMGSIGGNALDSNSFSFHGGSPGVGSPRGRDVGGGAAAATGAAGTDIMGSMGAGRWGSLRRRLMSDSRGCSDEGNIPRDDDDGGGGGDSDGDEDGDAGAGLDPSTLDTGVFGSPRVEQQQHAEAAEEREEEGKQWQRQQQQQQQQRQWKWKRSLSLPVVPTLPLGGGHGV